MEDIKQTLNNVNSSLNSFQEKNSNELKEMKLKNEELEKKNADLENEVKSAKENIMTLARQMEDMSIKSAEAEKDESSLEKKYLKNADLLLRGYANGNAVVNQDIRSNVVDLANNFAKKENLSSENLEKKFVQNLLGESDQSHFTAFELKTQNTATGSNSGFLLKPAKTVVYTPQQEKFKMIDLVDKMSVSQSMVDILEEGATDEGQFEGEEGGAKPENLKDFKIQIPTSIVKGIANCTRTMVEDYQGNFYQYIYPRMEKSLNKAIEKSIFTGNQVLGKPKGICTYDEIPFDSEPDKNVIRTQGVDDVNGLIDAIGDATVLLDDLDNLTIVMHPYTLCEIMKAKATDGRGLVQRDFLLEGSYYRIGGVKVVTSKYCPRFSLKGEGISNSKAVIIGDFKQAYTLVERTGKTIDLNPFNNNNEVIKYMLRQRIGGAVKGFEQLMIVKHN